MFELENHFYFNSIEIGKIEYNDNWQTISSNQIL